MSGFTGAPPNFLTMTCGIRVCFVSGCECGPDQDLLIVLTVIIPNCLILICKNRIHLYFSFGVKIVYGHSLDDGASPSYNLNHSC